MAAESSPLLLSLPPELLLTILEEVQDGDRKALGDFRIASRDCQGRADVVFYRTLSLYNVVDWWGERQPYNAICHLEGPPLKACNRHIKRLVARLEDPTDNLSKYVRHLAIGPFKGPSVVSQRSLCVILQNLESLQSFSWRTGHRITTRVANLFNERWPHCSLHVDQRKRCGMQLDTALLTLPQLTSLNLQVAYKNMGKRNNLCSEFPQLTKLVGTAKNLKSLGMLQGWTGERGYPRPRVHNDHRYFGPRCLRFQDGQRSVPLESVTFDNSYDNDPLYVAGWRAAMDWTHLRHLDTGENIPIHLLRALTGCVPELKSFSFRLHGYCSSTRTVVPPEELGEELAAFLGPIKALETIRCQIIRLETWAPCWASILKHQGRSLRSLNVRYVCDFAYHWDAKRLTELLEAAPGIQILKVELELPREEDSRVWPEKAQDVLLQFRHLRELHLAVPLDSSHHTPFARYDHNDIYLDEGYTEKVVTSLFNAYLAENGPCSTLEYLDVVFWRKNFGSINWRCQLRRVYFPLPGCPSYSLKMIKTGEQCSPSHFPHDPWG